jgi:serine/threonine-protein kinase
MRNDIQRALSGAPVAAPMLGAAYAGQRRPTGAPTQVAGRTAAISPYMYGPEDGGMGGPPQRQHRAWPWVVLAVVVVILIAAILLIKTINGHNSGNSIPDVKNDSVRAAENALQAQGFTVAGVQQVSSTTTPKGKVIRTSPPFGSTEPKGYRVTIFVSGGPKITKVPVPNVVGERRGAAVSKLQQAGFTVHVVPATSAQYPGNTVVSEKPSGSAPKGSTVTIGVTAKALTVPSQVIGMTLAQAESLLGAAPYGYQVTPVTTQGGNQGPVGTVYATAPGVGRPLAAGSPITIFIVGSATTSPPTSTSPPTTDSPSPTDSASSTPPGQGGGNATSGQSTPSPGTSGKVAN